MKPKQFHLGLALFLAMGALAAGCARDAPPAPAAATPMAWPAGHAAADQSHADDAHGRGDHAHEVAQAAGVDFPVPEGHVKWAPDGPLVEGMSRVRAAIDGLEQAEDDTAVLAGAAAVDAAIEYMFENCSLPVEPDIALHTILARLMAGAQAMSADPSDTGPVHDMQGAVANYEALFDDPSA